MCESEDPFRTMIHVPDDEMDDGDLWTFHSKLYCSVYTQLCVHTRVQSKFRTKFSTCTLYSNLNEIFHLNLKIAPFQMIVTDGFYSLSNHCGSTGNFDCGLEMFCRNI